MKIENITKNKKHIFIIFVMIIFFYKLISLIDGFPFSNNSLDITKESFVKGNEIIYVYTNFCDLSVEKCQQLKINGLNKKLKNNDFYLKEKIIEISENHAITVTKNSQLNHLYIFISNPETHFNLIKIYDIGGNNLELIKEKTFFSLNEVYFGDYDEKNNKIYLGIVSFDFSERNFLSKKSNSIYRERYLFD